MTPSEYIAWLDKEIEQSTQLRRDQDYDPEAVACCDGAIEAYKSMKTKFLTIQFPSQPEEIKQNVMNSEFRLEVLTIRYNDYGEFKGRFTGKVTFQNKESEGFMFNLSLEETGQFIKLLEPKLVASASNLGNKLLSSLNLLPAPSQPTGEYTAHENA